MDNIDDIINSLEVKEKELLSNLTRVRNAISELKGEYKEFEDGSSKTSGTILSNNQYEKKHIPKDGTWIEQIVSIIKNENRFLHTTEISEQLYSFYPNKTDHEVKRRVSSVLSISKRHDTVEGLVNYKFSNSKKDTVWGKADWLDENGNIKEKYKFQFSRDDKSQSRIEL